MNNAKLLIGIFYSDKEIYLKVIDELKKAFGEIEKQSFEYSFDKFTSYYEDEMGAGLVKRFLIFNKKINKKDLIEIKKKTTEIEKKYSKGEKRTINIDPGAVSKENVVLTSFKKRDFKEDLGNNIYSHEVLRFENEQIKVFWHTFPDFKSKEVQDFFNKIRKDLLKI